jgi:hypothetical protein
LSTTLRDRRIHHSNPSHFNDPWDRKPLFDTACVDDPVEFDALLEWFHGMGNPKLAPDLRGRVDKEHRASRDKRLELIDGISQKNIDQISKRGIYCLTPIATPELMWAHYGDHHRGICLEFGIDNPLFKVQASGKDALYGDLSGVETKRHVFASRNRNGAYKIEGMEV